MDTAHATLQIFLNQLGEPQPIREMATYFFELVLENVPSYQAHDALAAACIYRARLQQGLPTSLTAIGADAFIPKRKLFTSLSVVSSAQELAREKKLKPEYMENFCTPLHLPSAVQAAATKIYMKAVELNFVKEPEANAIAAAAAYKASQASDSPKTVLEIEEAVSVSEGDILQAFEKLLILPSFM
uniref:TFIIB domain-containing protein n=1 Tax=Panagrellus redivivus TaxID=6233 RepID=A0A7E4ZTH6_PANRE